MPHKPLHPSPAFVGKSKLGIYGDVIMELDWSVGEIVKTLKEEGIYENTIFVFTSDNGPDKGSANPLRGKKGQTWDGGQRVPGIITWPKVIPANVVSNEFVSTLDLSPTFAKVAGAKIPTGLKMDGADISTFLKAPKKVNVPDRPFYYYSRNGKLEAVREGKWKLHLKKEIGWNKAKEGEFTTALYNLEDDISEKKNVVAANPAVVAKLTALLNDFDAKLK